MHFHERIRSVLGLAMLATLSELACATEPVQYTKFDAPYGTFNHYILGPVSPGYVVYSPTNPAPNGAGIIVVASGGFFSPTTTEILNRTSDVDYESGSIPFLERGYTVFVLTHGDVINTTASVPGPNGKLGVGPGFTLQEINCQVERGARQIKLACPALGVNPNKLASAGGSAGAALALGLLTGGLGNPTHPYYDAMIDGVVSSRVACCFFNVGGGDGFNFRGPGDESWVSRNLRLTFQLDLTGLGYPPPSAPPCPILQSNFDNMGNPIGSYANAFEFFPELNFQNGLLDPNWQNYPYPLMTDPASPIFCNALHDDLKQYQAIYRLDSSVGPALGFNGADDYFVAPYQGQELLASAAALGLNFNIQTYADCGHYIRDPRKENLVSQLDFLSKNLLGVVDTDGDDLDDVAEATAGTSVQAADSDGDLVSDFHEVLGGTNALQGGNTFRITNVAAVPETDGTDYGVTITFGCGANRTYVLQRSSTIAPFADWKDDLVAGVPRTVTTGSMATSASFTFTVPFDQNGTTAPTEGAVYYRIRSETPNVFDRAHTHPAALVTTRVSRTENTPGPQLCLVANAPPTPTRVNYLSQAVWDAPRTIWVPTMASFSGANTIAFPPSFNPGSTPIDNRNILIVLRDGTRQLPAANPTDHGAEGRWWRIESSTATSLTVDLRNGESNLQSRIPAGSTVAIVPMPNLKTLFGPLPTPGPSCDDAAALGNFPIGIGDKLYRFENRAAYNPGTIQSDFFPYFYEVRLKPGSSSRKFEWLRTWTDPNHVPQTEVFADGASIRFYPDEVIKVVTRDRNHETYALSAGVVPLSSIDAYMLRAPNNGPTWRSIPGWPFPESVRLFDAKRVGITADSELMKFGFVGNYLNPTSGDSALVVDPTHATFSGDDGFYYPNVGGPLPAYGFIDVPYVNSATQYFHRPVYQSWQLLGVDLSQLESSTDSAVPHALNRLWAGRGIEIRLIANGSDRIMEWTRPLPYSLDD